MLMPHVKNYAMRFTIDKKNRMEKEQQQKNDSVRSQNSTAVMIFVINNMADDDGDKCTKCTQCT